ncbi:MAG: response regulator [Pirellulaceae bacterium]|nr:response regulator [Pirellulaceae bacterium]MDP7014296.1 response regulator [Pirellulaceae bacterium]
MQRAHSIQPPHFGRNTNSHPIQPQLDGSPSASHQSGPEPTVFVVDDDQAARESVCALISAMEVRVESYESPVDFLDAYDISRPGCLVTDVRMPDMTGLELQQRLREANATLPVILISAFIDVRGTVSAMRDGAVTVLTKPYEDQRLWDAIKHSLDLCQAEWDQRRRDADLMNRVGDLSDGERDVLNLVIEGVPNKTVAKRLGVSIRTVEDRRARIMKKLRVHSFAALLHAIHTARQIEKQNAAKLTTP